MNGEPISRRRESAWSDRLYLSRRHAVIALASLGGLLIFLVTLPEDTRQGLWHSLLSQRLLISLLGLFSLVTLSLLWSAGQQLDVLVFRRFNLYNYHPKWMDWVMLGLTQIGNGLLGLSLALAAYILGNRRLGVEIALGILSLWLVVEMVKAITERPRPYLHLTDIRLVGWRERGNSFPSGHTSQTFFMMTLLINHYELGIWGIIFFLGLAVAVGITRIYVGVHYPRDVIAGALLGSVWGILVSLVDPFLMGRAL